MPTKKMNKEAKSISDLTPEWRTALAEQVKKSTVLTVKEWVTFADSFGVNRQELCELMNYHLQKALETIDIDDVKPLELGTLAKVARKILGEKKVK